MGKETNYMIITVESYPYGWETNHFYLPVRPGFMIGDVITSQNGKQYRVIDGKTQVRFEDIDLKKYSPFEQDKNVVTMDNGVFCYHLHIYSSLCAKIGNRRFLDCNNQRVLAIIWLLQIRKEWLEK